METKEENPVRRDPERGKNKSDLKTHNKDNVIPLNYKHLGEKISLNDLKDTQLAQDEDVIRAEDYRVTLGRDVPKPDVAIKHNGGSIATLGNLSMVIGRAKSRKSFFIGIMAAAASKSDGLYGYRTELPADKRKVIIFDTEQSEYYAQLALKRMQVLGANMNDIVMYALRPLDTIERIDFIEKIIYTTPDIGLVFIDGIRDLVFDINDAHEATELVTKLMRWSYDLNIHIVNVLHQNKNDGNARGHLGSELTNKCETVLSVAKTDEDDAISVVSAEYCRSVEPSDFYFEIDEDGLPVEAKHAEVRTTKDVSWDVKSVPDEDYFRMFKNIFSKKETISYGNLVEETRFHFREMFNRDLWERQAKAIITYARHKGLLIQSEERKPYRLGTINEELQIDDVDVSDEKNNDLPF